MVVMWIFSRFFKSIIFMLLMVCFSANAEVADPPTLIAALPKYFIGSWRVKAVRINVEIGASRGLQLNDPELMGRRFRFTEEYIAYNTPGAWHCIKPKAVKWVVEANKLLEITMGKKGMDEPYQPAAVEDFWLPIKGDKIVDVFILTCTDGHVGPRASLELPYPLNTKYFGTWLVLFNKDEMAMKWHDDTILLLRRENKGVRRR